MFLKYKKLCHQGFWQGRTVLLIKNEDFLVCPKLFISLFSSLLSSLIQEFSGGMPSMAETSTFWLLGGKATLIAIIVHKNSGIYLHKELIESWQACYSHSFSPMEEASEKPANLLCHFCKRSVGESGPCGYPAGLAVLMGRGHRAAWGAAQGTESGPNSANWGKSLSHPGPPVLILERQMGKKSSISPTGSWCLSAEKIETGLLCKSDSIRKCPSLLLH